MDQTAESSRRTDRQLPAAHRRALGARIRQRRRDKQWKQRELAKHSGIRPLRLSTLENGHATPSLPELLRLADALDTGLDELARGVPAQGQPLPGQPWLQELAEIATPEEAAILAKLLRVLLAGFRATQPGGRSTEGRDVQP